MKVTTKRKLEDILYVAIIVGIGAFVVLSTGFLFSYAIHSNPACYGG